ncbi:hypothetical protein ACOMHN_041620 [Nucella lapillus]
MDIEDWCQQNGLWTDTSRQLHHEGFATAEDLRDVTQDDVRVTFQKRGKLPLQQCVALREALTDFHQGKARRRHRKGITIAEWSERHDLDAETTKVLEKEGFTTDDDMKYVTAYDVNTTFQKKGVLPLQQCIALRRALEGASTAGHQNEDSSKITRVSGTDDIRGQDITSCRPSASHNKTQYSGQRVNDPQAHQRGVKYRMVVAGTEGSGKTRTVQSILSQQDDTIQDLQGGQRVEEFIEDISLGTLSSGWLGTSREPPETAAVINTDLHHLSPGPHAVLYTIDVSSRYTAEQGIIYRRLQAIFSHSLQPYLILVFTHGDSLCGKGIQDLLRTAPTELKQVLNECQGRYVLFDNKNLQRDQAHDLLDLLQKVRAQNLPTPCLSVAVDGAEAAEEIGKRLLEVEEDLMEHTSFVQTCRQQQKESGKRMKRSKKVLEKRVSNSSREQRELQLQMSDLEKRVERNSLRLHTFCAGTEG